MVSRWNVVNEEIPNGGLLRFDVILIAEKMSAKAN
jgi:hypothetical protein